MKFEDISKTLAVLGTGASLTGCAGQRGRATEAPAAEVQPAADRAPNGQCLHSEGCCGGHTPGDASCGGEGSCSAQMQKPAPTGGPGSDGHEHGAAEGDSHEHGAAAKGGSHEHGSPATATPEGWQRTWTVSPKKMAEINVELKAGASMAANFSTDGGALEWNVHSHQGTKAVIHAQGKDASGQPKFVAERDGLYSFLWRNQGDKPVTVKIDLKIEGEGAVHSSDPK